MCSAVPGQSPEGNGCHDGSHSPRRPGANGNVARRDRPAAVQHRAGRRHPRAERFRFYITQDALYLAEYARVLAIAAAKAPDAATVRWLPRRPARQSLSTGIARALSGRVRGRSRDAAAAEPSPDCLAYTSYLLATAHQQPWEVTGRGDPAVFLDLLGCGRRDRPKRDARKPVSRLDRHLRRPAFRRGRASGHRHRRPRRRDRLAADPRRDARRLCPLGAIRVPVLGRRYQRRFWPVFE